VTVKSCFIATISSTLKLCSNKYIVLFISRHTYINMYFIILNTNLYFNVDLFALVLLFSIAAVTSLHNPSNHKSVGFNDVYNQCHCPQWDEEIKSHDIQFTNVSYEYGYAWHTTVSHHYNSALKCSSTTSCTVQHTGEAWTPSVLPPVVAVTDVVMNVAPPFLSCQFTSIAGKAHSVKW